MTVPEMQRKLYTFCIEGMDLECNRCPFQTLRCDFQSLSEDLLKSYIMILNMRKGKI